MTLLYRYLHGAAFATAVVTAISLAAVPLPACAQEKAPADALDAIMPQTILKDIIREDDVTLLFKHLRESLAAAARGEDAQESDALKRRAEQLQRDLALRGSALMGALLNAVEAEAKRALRDLMREPAPRVPGGT
jgi:hypothetical protein